MDQAPKSLRFEQDPDLPRGWVRSLDRVAPTHLWCIPPSMLCPEHVGRMRAGLLQVIMRAAFDLLRQEAQFGQAALQTPQLHRLMKEMAAEGEHVPSPSEIHTDLTKRSARALDQSRRLAALADRLIEKGNLSPEEWRQVAECVESALGFTPVAMTAWRIAADAGDEIARHVFEASAIGIASANDDKPVPFWHLAGGYVVPPGPPLAALIREMLAEVVPHE